MKIGTNFFLMILATLVLMSCGEDENMMPVDLNLDGTWMANSMIGDINVTYILDGDTSINFNAIEGRDINYNLDISQGTFVTAGSYAINYVTTFDGVTIENFDNFNYNDVNQSGAFITNDNQLSIDGELFRILDLGLPVIFPSGLRIAEVNQDGNVLTITQTGVVEKTETTGLQSSSDISITSTWERQ